MKRGENIYHRSDGRWEGRYIKGRKKDGKPRYGYVYARSYREVRDILLPLKLRYKEGANNSSSEFHGLFGVYWRGWLMSKEESVKPSTLAVYRRMAENHILPSLGKVSINKITQSNLIAFKDELKGKGLKDSMIHSILRLLLSILKKYINPEVLQGFELPIINTPKIPILTKTEQAAIETVALKDRHGDSALLALYTGMRLGEISALRWQDVDLIEGLIHVKQTVQRLETKLGKNKTILHFSSPKTVMSERIIPIPNKLLTYLKKLKLNSNSDYVVNCKTRLAEPRVVQYRLEALLKKAGVRRIHFHALRHTFAVRCLEIKMDIVTLSHLLGHTSAKMTLDVYGGSLIEHKKKEVQALNRIWVSDTRLAA